MSIKCQTIDLVFRVIWNDIHIEYKQSDFMSQPRRELSANWIVDGKKTYECSTAKFVVEEFKKTEHYKEFVHLKKNAKLQYPEE